MGLPDKQIPELRFASAQDWLNATRGSIQKDEEIRQSLALLRQSAKWDFTPLLQNALMNYINANNGLLPADLSQLKPPMALCALERMLPPGDSSKNGGAIRRVKPSGMTEYSPRLNHSIRRGAMKAKKGLCIAQESLHGIAPNRLGQPPGRNGLPWGAQRLAPAWSADAGSLCHGSSQPWLSRSQFPKSCAVS
jgi:hypothetical protein